MGEFFKIQKRGITVILTLCILLGVAGTCLNVTAMAEETTVATETTTVTIVETTVATEETTVVADETTKELVPMMARGCGDPLTKYFGSDYTVTRKSGPWIYISGANGITGGYNTSTGYGYVQMTDGSTSRFYT